MENNGGKYSGFFSKKLRAGKRRTYFFDVRSTKQGDFFLTITESKKKFDSDGYESHKIFLYKEDFKKFIEALNETLDHVKTELMPDYDYDAERTPRSDDQGDDHSHGDRPQRPPRNERNSRPERTADNNDHTRRRNIDDYPDLDQTENVENPDQTDLKPDPNVATPNTDYKSSSGIADDEEIKWG
ncbi:MAG: hypothetical protein JWO03_2587 [Bacteroidetes bacterium]|nr:hypothetical protein [Bacteroidota bacterium]